MYPTWTGQWCAGPKAPPRPMPLLIGLQQLSACLLLLCSLRMHLCFGLWQNWNGLLPSVDPRCCLSTVPQLTRVLSCTAGRPRRQGTQSAERFQRALARQVCARLAARLLHRPLARALQEAAGVHSQAAAAARRLSLLACFSSVYSWYLASGSALCPPCDTACWLFGSWWDRMLVPSARPA